MAWAGLCLASLTFVVTNCFSKQRIFPVNISSWVLALTCAHYIRDLFRWATYTSIPDNIITHQTDTICFFLFGFEVWIQSAVALCNIFMSFSMYNMVIRKRDMSYSSDPRYMRYMIGTIVVWPLVMYISVLGASPYYPGCRPTENGWNILLFVQWGVAVILETFFLSKVLWYIRQVVLSAQRISQPTSKRTVWLAIRFSSIVLLQTIPKILWNIIYIHYDIKLSFALYQPYYILAFICFALESLVILYGNRQLREKVIRIAYKVTNNSYSSSNSSEEQAAVVATITHSNSISRNGEVSLSVVLDQSSA
eukprot:TRINITY_DN6249_c0_g1_i2.p1 TRINITY_DN6249_c0_g1~~TRINITY_DN6249_c0_g1_i2.p1  ORF type:complete len:308 (+),score=28.82 TRINITY_DN6249_c0_g1_i2:230-1153(+)